MISTTPPEGCEEYEESIEYAWITHLRKLQRFTRRDDEPLKDKRQRSERLIDGMHEIAREIRDAIFPTLRRLAPSPAHATTELESGPVRKTVAQFMFPRSIKLEVLAGHHEELDQVCLVVPWATMREIGFEPDIVPTFAAEDVLLERRRLASGLYVYDFAVPVMDEKTAVVGKIVRPWVYTQQRFRRELEIHRQLMRLNLNPATKIPELIGLITYGDGVVGVLTAKIDVKYPSLEPFITGNPENGVPSVSQSLRRKWAAQVEHTVKELHLHGIVWGNAHPDNVIIDVDNNAWLLNFGGGGSSGWLHPDPSLFETKENDLWAVAKMKKGLWCVEDAE